MSVLTYNGVILPYCMADRFEQDAVYEDSLTDRYLTKFDVSVQCVINSNSLNLIAPDLFNNGSPVTANPAAIMNVIRSRLLTARKALSYKFNGVELIPQPQTGNSGIVDAKHGPQPQRCTITDLTNNTFLVLYRITANYWENNRVTTTNPNLVVNQPGNNVLYNRWSETAEIDGTNFSKRIREGKFIIRSDNADGFLADQLRSQMAVVSVPNGFLRESATYTITPDGLGLQYRIVDREFFKGPPVPAFIADGEYTERATRLGAIRYGQVRVNLKGSKTSSQSNMIRVSVEVARTIINMAAGNSTAYGYDAAVILIDASVTRGLYRNEVECRILAQIAAGPKSGPDLVAGIAAFAGMSTYTPGSDVSQFVTPTGVPIPIPATGPPPYNDRGTAGILLQAAAYFDPSIVSNKLGPTDVPTGPNPITGTGPASEQMTKGMLPGKAGQTRET